jgi:hypothetical protein
MTNRSRNAKNELRRYLQNLSKAIENELPPGPSKRGKCLFALVLIVGGRMHYASNSRQRGMVRALHRMADRIGQKRLAESIGSIASR